MTVELLEELVKFRTTHDLLHFVREDGIVNYTTLEERLHHGYPMTATAVSATRANLNRRHDDLDDGFLVADLPLSPEAVSGRLWMYPLEAASAAYAFALFEMYGQALTEILRRAPFKGSWHRGVNDRSDLSDPVEANAARKRFSADLNVPHGRVALRLLTELQALKNQRNQIVHEGRHSGRFVDFYPDLIRVVCRLHFIAVPGDRYVIVSPWPDYHGEISRPHGAGIFRHVPG